MFSPWANIYWLLIEHLLCNWASQVTLVLKNLPESAGNAETGIRSVGWEDPLKEDMTTNSSILENPKDRVAWRATVRGVTKSWTWLKSLSMRHIIELTYITHVKLSWTHQMFILVWWDRQLTIKWVKSICNMPAGEECNEGE